MAGGRIWGPLLFVFLVFAAMSTVIAVFENIISFAIDLLHWSRKKACIVNTFLLIILSLPCALGFNVLSHIQFFGDGSNIMDLEDFIISNNVLPLGSMVYVLFCTLKNKGWGWDNFMNEVNTGEGIKFPQKLRVYATFILPIVLIVLWAQGYIAKFVTH